MDDRKIPLLIAIIFAKDLFKHQHEDLHLHGVNVFLIARYILSLARKMNFAVNLPLLPSPPPLFLPRQNEEISIPESLICNVCNKGGRVEPILPFVVPYPRLSTEIICRKVTEFSFSFLLSSLFYLGRSENDEKRPRLFAPRLITRTISIEFEGIEREEK